jgi:hypothetical protein
MLKLANYTEMSSSQESASCTDIQALLRKFWNQKVPYVFTRAFHWHYSEPD